MRVIGHGIDLVEIARVERMLIEHGDRFIERCFTDVEREYCEQSVATKAERYAARLACKEAVFKALGTGWSNGIGWRDVEVRREPSGRPNVQLSGRCAELARARGIQAWDMSLSHTSQHAMASVIGCGD